MCCNRLHRWCHLIIITTIKVLSSQQHVCNTLTVIIKDPPYLKRVTTLPCKYQYSKADYNISQLSQGSVATHLRSGVKVSLQKLSTFIFGRTGLTWVIQKIGWLKKYWNLKVASSRLVVPDASLDSEWTDSSAQFSLQDSFCRSLTLIKTENLFTIIVTSQMSEVTHFQYKGSDVPIC